MNTFRLDPKVLVALSAHFGADLWHHATLDGRSIRRALDYLVPFAFDPSKWTHKQIEPS